MKTSTVRVASNFKEHPEVNTLLELFHIHSGGLVVIISYSLWFLPHGHSRPLSIATSGEEDFEITMQFAPPWDTFPITVDFPKDPGHGTHTVRSYNNSRWFPSCQGKFCIHSTELSAYPSLLHPSTEGPTTRPLCAQDTRSGAAGCPLNGSR